jgi:hypothetical protein
MVVLDDHLDATILAEGSGVGENLAPLDPALLVFPPD